MQITRYANDAREARQIRDALITLKARDIKVLVNGTWQARDNGDLIFANGWNGREVDWDDLDNARLKYLRIRIDRQWIAAQPWKDRYGDSKPFIIEAYL